MIKHIVMWKFVENKDGKNKQEIMDFIKASLLKLPLFIPEIKSMEIGKDALESDEMAFDMALITLFEDKEALHRYKIHPEHKKVSEYVKSVRTARATVDFIC